MNRMLSPATLTGFLILAALFFSSRGGHAVENPWPEGQVSGVNSESLVYCEGETIHLVSSVSGGDSYLWTGPNGFVSTATEPVIPGAVASHSGSYYCVVTTGGIPAPAEAFEVVVHSAPVATLGPDRQICDGSFVLLFPGYSGLPFPSPVPGQSYVWSTGATTQSIQVSSPGDYQVTVNNSQNCTANDVASVSFYSPIAIPGPEVVSPACQATSYDIHAGSGTSNWIWSTGANTETLTVTQSGWYWVTMSDSHGCVGSDSIRIQFLNPVVEATESEICPGLSTTLSLTGLTYQGGPIAGFSYQGEFNGHYYYVSTATATWQQAFQACQAAGGHLATISSSGENTFVANLPGGSKYIGFTDEANEGVWQWVTGEPVVFTAWNSSEPNNWGDEDYAQTNVGGSLWNDLSGTNYLPYVLEFDQPSQYTFLWSTGETTSSITVSPATTTTYTVTVSDGYSTCTADFQVLVSMVPQVSIQANGGTNLCIGQSVTLTSAGSWAGYQWKLNGSPVSGATASSMVVNSGGTYSLSALTYCGWIDSPGMSVTVTDPLDGVVGTTGSGLLAYYPMDGNVLDISGNGNHGTAINSPTYVSGHLGSALFLNGAAQFVTIPNLLNGRTQYTFSAWFKYVNSNTWRWLFGTGSGFVYAGAAVAAGSNHIRYHSPCSSGGNGSHALSPNTWYHFTYVYNANEGVLRGYINGSLDYTISCPYTLSTGMTNALGAGFWGNSEYYYGALDEVRIYNRALLTPEIQALNTSTVLSSNSPVCQGGSLQLTAPYINAATYLWTGPASFSSTQQNPVLPNLTASQEGTYQVVITAQGCQSLPQSVYADVVEPLAVNLGPDQTIFSGTSTTLSSNVSGTTYAWSTGATSPSISVSTAGLYSLTVTNACGNFTDQVNIAVENPPVLAISPTALTAGVNFGAGYEGTVLLSNTGPSTLSFSITNLPSWLTLSATTGTIPGGGGLTLTLTTPSTLTGGLYSANLVITTNETVQPIHNFPLNLTVYQASMSVSPGSLAFGNVVKNTTASAVIYLHNTGNLDITVNTISTQAPFSAGTWEPVLAAGATMAVPVNFSPPSTLIYAKTLLVSTSFGDFSVSLTGTGENPAPAWSFGFTNYAFGYTDILNGGTTQLAIHNTGNVPVVVSAVESTSLYFSASETAFDIPVGGVKLLNLAFAPDNMTAYSGIVSFVSSNCGIQLITLTGTGMIVTPAPSLTFPEETPFQGVSGVNPEVGPGSSFFQYKVVYTDPDNHPPLAGYPKLGIDRNGDGDFLDPDEDFVTLSAETASDLDYSDGKVYTYITSFSVSAFLGYQFQGLNAYGNTAIGEGTLYHQGPLVSDDLLDISIFANDISFSDATPDIGQEITISATIHNNSDYPAGEPFSVEFWKEDTLMGVQTVPYLAAQSATTLSMTHTFSWSEFYPIKVIIDAGDVLEEDNELNNFAIRPVTVGDFSIPGSIAVTGVISPGEVYYTPGNSLPLMHFMGHAAYVGSFDPDTDVSGATVSLTLEETGTTYYGYTNANGDFDFYFYSPVPAEGLTQTYHLLASCTDYTLTGYSDTIPYIVHSTVLVHKPDLNVWHYAGYGWEPNIFWTDSCIVVNEPIDVAVYVWNSGDATAYNVDFFGYKDDPSNVTFSTSYTSLDPGEAQWEYFTVSYATEGDHSVGIWTDRFNTVDEWNEDNNHASKTRHIYNLDVDLAPTNFWVSNWNPLEGQQVMMGLTVSNLLCNYTGVSSARLYDIYGTDTTLIGTLPYPNFSPMSSLTRYVYNYAFTGTGTHTIMAVADYFGEVGESNEDNNIAYWYVNVPVQMPDLTFATYPWWPLDYSVGVSSSNVDVGDEINFYASIKNFGNGNASDFYVRFRLDGVLVGDPLFVPFLAAGQSLTLYSDPWTITSCGHILTVSIDEANTVAESNETNNLATKTNIGVDLNPGNPWGSAWAGSPAIIGAYIYNHGVFEADNVPLYYYCTDCDPGNPALLLGTDVVAHVPATGYVYSHIIHTFNTPGVYHVCVVADSTLYCELNESNNVACGIVVIQTERPDLMVHSYHISPTELNPDPGETISLYSSFENTSNVASGPFKVQFLMDSNPIGDPILVSNLGAHQDTTVACSESWSSTLIGPHIIRVLLDTDHEVAENIEWNNEASRAVIVGDAPDMKFVALDPLSLSNPTPTTGDWVTISAHIKNAGGAGGQALANFYYVTGSDSTLISSIPFTLNDHDSLFVTVPWQAQAAFGLLVCVISDCDPMEFNLFNNTASLNYGSTQTPLAVQVFASDQLVCPGSTIQLVAIPSGGSGTYEVTWVANPDLALASGASILTSVGQTTVFTATVQDGFASVQGSLTITTHVVETPSISGLAASYCSNEAPVTLSLYPEGGVLSGNGISGTSFDPSAAGNGQTGIRHLYTGQSGCQVSVTEYTTVYAAPAAELLVQGVSCNGQSDGSIEVQVNPEQVTSFAWSNGVQTSLNTNLPAGPYTLTLTGDGNCQTVYLAQVDEPAALALTLEATQSSLTGQSLLNLSIEGGTSPYTVIWSDGSTNEDISPIEEPTYSVTVTDTHQCVETGVFSEEQITSQTLHLQQGWNIYSTHISPTSPLIHQVFAPVVSSLIIIKNENGQIYWPAFGIQGIGAMATGRAYVVKMSSAQDLVISGSLLVPENTPIPLHSGWGLLGYLRTTPANISTLLAPISGQIVLVKNGAGQIFWPGMGVNGIGNMVPGMGYSILMLSSATLTYPPNAANLSKTWEPGGAPSTFGSIAPTGSNMTLAIPEEVWKNAGLVTDRPLEVGVLGEQGLLVGSAVWQSGSLALTLWGDDPLSPEPDGLREGETFNLMLFDPETGTTRTLTITEWKSGAGRYTDQQVSIAGGVAFHETAPGLHFSLVAPNPFRHRIAIGFVLPEDGPAELAVYDLTGRKIQTLTSGLHQKGEQIRYWETDHPQGAYVVQLNWRNQCIRQLILKTQP